MPGFDRRGPMGAGPMTGGGRGLCAAPYADYSGRYPFGYGRGRRMGYGLGFRRGFGARGGRGAGWGQGYPVTETYDPYAGRSHIDLLKEEAQYMRDTLERLNRQIGDLEKAASKGTGQGEVNG